LILSVRIETYKRAQKIETYGKIANMIILSACQLSTKLVGEFFRSLEIVDDVSNGTGNGAADGATDRVTDLVNDRFLLKLERHG
jgi:hypothetical protein